MALSPNSTLSFIPEWGDGPLDSPEPDLLQVKGVLDDAGGGHPDPEYVLLGAHVVGLGYPVYVRQVATRKYGLPTAKEGRGEFQQLTKAFFTVFFLYNIWLNCKKKNTFY